MINEILLSSISSFYRKQTLATNQQMKPMYAIILVQIVAALEARKDQIKAENNF